MFGYNKLEEKKVGGKGRKKKRKIIQVLCFLKILIFILLLINTQENKILKFLGFMWNPLSWVMEAAALMAIALAHGGVSL